MKTIPLGSTGLSVTKTAMGCLPLQRCEKDYAVRLLQAAYDGGIRYFDTANAYTASEEKIGLALADVRGEIVLSTKSQARDRAGVLAHIENSLKMLRTDHIDLFQFHNVPEMPSPDDPEGAFAGAAEAKRRGWIDHIGVTTHRVGVAEDCIASGLFETLQFPFSYISSERDLALADKCKAAGMGFIAMKGLAGGLLTNARACHAFMKGYDNVVPIWGIQRMEELEEWLAVEAVLHPRVAGKDESDRGLSRLPPMRLALSLRAGHAESPEIHAQGLPRVLRRAQGRAVKAKKGAVKKVPKRKRRGIPSENLRDLFFFGIV